MSDRIKALEEEMARLLDYLCLKVDQRDWQGVADAAMDMRELERELKVRREYDRT